MPRADNVPTAVALVGALLIFGAPSATSQGEPSPPGTVQGFIAGVPADVQLFENTTVSFSVRLSASVDCTWIGFEPNAPPPELKVEVTSTGASVDGRAVWEIKPEKFEADWTRGPELTRAKYTIDRRQTFVLRTPEPAAFDYFSNTSFVTAPAVSRGGECTDSGVTITIGAAKLAVHVPPKGSARARLANETQELHGEGTPGFAWTHAAPTALVIAVLVRRRAKA